MLEYRHAGQYQPLQPTSIHPSIHPSIHLAEHRTQNTSLDRLLGTTATDDHRRCRGNTPRHEPVRIACLTESSAKIPWKSSGQKPRADKRGFPNKPPWHGSETQQSSGYHGSRVCPNFTRTCLQRPVSFYSSQDFNSILWIRLNLVSYASPHCYSDIHSSMFYFIIFLHC